jgi:oligosaccharyltransferase complex subunit delta (ribophorin II)
MVDPVETGKLYNHLGEVRKTQHRRQWNDLHLKTPFIGSPNILAFILLLSAFEVLLIWYWIALKLGEVLLYGGILGVFTILAGKQALAQIGKRRVGQKQP